MKKQDADLRELLRDLGRALSQSIAGSPEIGRTLRRFHDEGYTLHLTLDCKRQPPAVEPVVALARPSARQNTAGEPSFTIDARDLSFLRSIGIDPTRRLRRRKL